MLMIRLQRVGKKKQPTYRLIVSEKTKDTHDKYVELLGSFNPHLKEGGFLPKADRIKYWISVGAQPSDTVRNLLINAGVITGKKSKSVFLSGARKAKLEEKKKAKIEADEKSAAAKVAAAEAEKAAAEEAAKVALEAPAEEAVAETPAVEVAPEEKKEEPPTESEAPAA